MDWNQRAREIAENWLFDYSPAMAEEFAALAAEAYQAGRARQAWAAYHADAGSQADVLLERERYHEALLSIAKSTCCGRCQEAALVAQAALRAGRGEDFPDGRSTERLTRDHGVES